MLNNLNCTKCKGLLYPPVFLTKNNENLCKECRENLTKNAKKFSIRNKLFEEMAKLFTYPCKFAASGCIETVNWSQAADHTKTCKYQQVLISCLVNACNWKGNHEDIIVHCKTDHNEIIVKHPFEISKYASWIIGEMKNLQNVCSKKFLMIAHGFVFILHFNICFNSDSMWTGVYLNGCPQLAVHFEYFVKLSEKSLKANDIHIKQVLANVIKFDESKYIKSGLEQNVTISINMNKIKCINCKQEFFQIPNNWLKCCDDWNLKRNETNNSTRVIKQCTNFIFGCEYYDVFDNLTKHASVLCKYNTFACKICPFINNEFKTSEFEHIKLCAHSHSYKFENQVMNVLSTKFNDILKGLLIYQNATFLIQLHPEMHTFNFLLQTIRFNINMMSDLPHDEEKNLTIMVTFSVANNLESVNKTLKLININSEFIWHTHIDIVLTGPFPLYSLKYSITFEIS